MKNVLKEVLAEIKPSPAMEKEVFSRISDVLSIINNGLRGATAILGGSGVKGTWLKETNDADIFVKFGYAAHRDKSGAIADLLEKHIKGKFAGLRRLHGSRDYFQMERDGFLYELVPILDIKKAEQAANITDVSPLHAAYVNKHGKGLKNDIRLLKQFCRAQKVYGAESFIQGFSGYICELLVLAYGGFIPLVRQAAKWKNKVVLDVAGHWKGKDVLMELNKSKLISPLVIVDPVQKDRNAGAAVSVEKFEGFRKACKELLKKPTRSLFEVTALSYDYFKEKFKGAYVIQISVKPHSGKRDVIGCQLMKGLGYLRAELLRHDFTVLDSGLEWAGKAFYFVVVKREKMSKLVERQGPPVSRKEHVAHFKKKHRKTVTRKGRIIGIDVRPFIEPVGLLESLKKDRYLKGKIKGFSVTCP